MVAKTTEAQLHHANSAITDMKVTISGMKRGDVTLHTYQEQPVVCHVKPSTSSHE